MENKYNNADNKLLLSKIEDRIQFCRTKNKIVYTDFLNISEKSVVQKYLKQNNIKNYIFYGVKEEADRNILFIYPEKLSEDFVKQNYNNFLEMIKIKLPKCIVYEHREYLSGIMKLGIRREKFGDIIVYEEHNLSVPEYVQTAKENGAYIIVLKEISEYILNNIKGLTRFKKSEISIVDISELKSSEVVFQEIKIIVSSIRLDSIVAELYKCSRTKATDMIEEARVFVNSVNEFKLSKKIDIGSIITIRGKGKFVIDSIEKETKNKRIVLKVKKYI